MTLTRPILLMLFTGMLSACGSGWNNPYPDNDADAKVLYSAFSERPKHLDPARSYSSNEVEFTGQIYEPPLQYHFLKRPYTLIPLTAAEVPTPVFYDAEGARLPDDAPSELIARSVYEVSIRPGIQYQPHPAFAKDEAGQYRYHAIDASVVANKRQIGDFPHVGTRELVAADYVYQIKRLANPQISSPIFGLMSDYIVGLKELGETLAQAAKQQPGKPLRLEDYPLAGVELVDRYTYRIHIKGKYPQFNYWLAMPFFAPIPWEAEVFYSQPHGAEEEPPLPRRDLPR